jgi:hypothetical protein
MYVCMYARNKHRILPGAAAARPPRRAGPGPPGLPVPGTPSHPAAPAAAAPRRGPSRRRPHPALSLCLSVFLSLCLPLSLHPSLPLSFPPPPTPPTPFPSTTPPSPRSPPHLCPLSNYRFLSPPLTIPLILPVPRPLSPKICNCTRKWKNNPRCRVLAAPLASPDVSFSEAKSLRPVSVMDLRLPATYMPTFMMRLYQTVHLPFVYTGIVPITAWF